MAFVSVTRNSRWRLHQLRNSGGVINVRNGSKRTVAPASGFELKDEPEFEPEFRRRVIVFYRNGPAL